MPFVSPCPWIKRLILTAFLAVSVIVLPSLVWADGLPNIPASVDPGAILNAQWMNRYYHQQLFFLNGPLNQADLEPDEPVIIDEQGVLPQTKAVRGQVQAPKP
jgi:hypothetical protein